MIAQSNATIRNEMAQVKRRLLSGQRWRALLLASLLPLAACAAPADPGAMTAPLSEATLLPAASGLRQAVQMGQVAGGRETHPLWKSDVSSTDFAEALRRSLRAHAMLGSGAGAYRLDAELLRVDQPFGGINLEVSAEVRYRLVRLSDNATVFDQVINKAYTASFGSSLVAVTRLKLANEGAIRENISALIAALVAQEKAQPGIFGVPVAELEDALRRALLPA
ncbi:hypothetical protein NON00_21945 [Roseomonas sp. GC11]|uniref:hypothetical protein n=1 Tax=Roseomonas sp. GC11 TaxID=2950546 RepID=UPI00210E52C8|nr:hypothetical protein [Roseomonas sp. GC11]MCQ4162576.1 hypothetical protein [Roseomonas sp. GC11]